MKGIISILLGGCILVIGIAGINAHGGGELIANSEQTGPYKVSVWLNPPDPRAQEPLHFTIGIASPIDDSPVLDANVTIELLYQQEIYSAPATTEQAVNRLFYEADIEVPQPGIYQTTILVSGPEGSGEINLETTISEPAHINWFYWGLVGLGLMVFIGIWRSKKTIKRETGE